MDFNLAHTYHDLVVHYLPWANAWGGIVDLSGVIVLTLIAGLLTRGFLYILYRLYFRSRKLWGDAFYRSVNAPLQILIWVIALSMILNLLLPSNAHWQEYINRGRTLLLIIVGEWFILRLVAAIEENALTRPGQSDSRMDAMAADIMANLTRAVTLVITALLVLKSLGVPPSSLMAFSSIGGLAIGFAARDVLANLFGGLSVYINRPFSIGDWISSPDQDIEGVVEGIGWRATTVRRFDKSPLYIPNATFSRVSLENPSRMSHRQIRETISIRFQDANIVPDLVRDIRQLLDEDEHIDSNEAILTYLNGIGQWSLNLLVWCYTHTTEWAEYLAIKQGILQRVQHCIEDHGGSLAQPATTVQIPEEIIISRSAAPSQPEESQEDIDTQKVKQQEKQDVTQERTTQRNKVGAAPDEDTE